MGLLNGLLGGSRTKKNLIRQLAKLRIRNNPMAEALGLSEATIDKLSNFRLAGSPEGAIVAIVDTYCLHKKKMLSDDELLMMIERHRSRLGSGRMPSPLTLSAYIKYRIKIEYIDTTPDSVPIDDEFIDDAIEICKQAFSCS